MNGRKNFRRSPEEMKVIKTLFPDKPLERRLDKFSPKTTPLKFRG